MYRFQRGRYTRRRVWWTASRVDRPTDKLVVIYICEIALRIECLSRRLGIHWIPAHAGVLGNKSADITAKKSYRMESKRMAFYADALTTKPPNFGISIQNSCRPPNQRTTGGKPEDRDMGGLLSNPQLNHLLLFSWNSTP